MNCANALSREGSRDAGDAFAGYVRTEAGEDHGRLQAALERRGGGRAFASARPRPAGILVDLRPAFNILF